MDVTHAIAVHNIGVAVRHLRSAHAVLDMESQNTETTEGVIVENLGYNILKLEELIESLTADVFPECVHHVSNRADECSFKGGQS